MRYKILLLCLVSALILGCVKQYEKHHITLNDSSGIDTQFFPTEKRLKIGDKPYMLFFFGTDCGVCKAAIPDLNALENVMIAQYYHSSVDEEDAKKALEAVGLSHRLTHRPSQLSGGEQQRLCIARSLINDPEILIADEPTGNLDEANERIILDLFCKLRKDGKTILLVTHNPDLGEYGDKIVYLRHGKLEKIRTIENPKVPNAI